MSFSTNLKKLREMAGLTQEELANKAKISKSAVMDENILNFLFELINSTSLL